MGTWGLHFRTLSVGRRGFYRGLDPATDLNPVFLSRRRTSGGISRHSDEVHLTLLGKIYFPSTIGTVLSPESITESVIAENTSSLNLTLSLYSRGDPLSNVMRFFMSEGQLVGYVPPPGKKHRLDVYAIQGAPDPYIVRTAWELPRNR